MVSRSVVLILSVIDEECFVSIFIKELDVKLVVSNSYTISKSTSG